MFIYYEEQSQEPTRASGGDYKKMNIIFKRSFLNFPFISLISTKASLEKEWESKGSELIKAEPKFNP